MDFLTAVKTCFSKYATFTGRARRSEYWWFALCSAIVSWIPIVQFLGILFIIPSIAVGVRRLHDVGKSGWWYLLAFVPIANLYIIYLAIVDSQAGDNEYGSNPKA